MNEDQYGLQLNDINPESDVFLTETRVHWRGNAEREPTIHIVKSYYVESKDRFYYIFEHKAGTKAIHFTAEDYKQLESFIDLSDEWTIFFREQYPALSDLLFLVPHSSRYNYRKNRF